MIMMMSALSVPMRPSIDVILQLPVTHPQCTLQKQGDKLVRCSAHSALQLNHLYPKVMQAAYVYFVLARNTHFQHSTSAYIQLQQYLVIVLCGFGTRTSHWLSLFVPQGSYTWADERYCRYFRIRQLHLTDRSSYKLILLLFSARKP